LPVLRGKTSPIFVFELTALGDRRLFCRCRPAKKSKCNREYQARHCACSRSILSLRCGEQTRQNLAHMKTTTLPLRHSMNRVSCPLALLLIPLAFACFALLPQAQAVCQEGCDTTNFNTFLGDDALLNNTGPIESQRTTRTKQRRTGNGFEQSLDIAGIGVLGNHRRQFEQSRLEVGLRLNR
jgi:hypothetical protein